MTSSRRTILPIIIAGLALLALYIGLTFIPTPGKQARQLHIYLSIFGLAFAIYLFSIYWTRRAPLTGKSIWLIIVFAAAFRLSLIGVWPSISTDFHRYMWDGHIANSGINPYVYHPGSPKLVKLRTDYWPRINYKARQTPYPPGAQMVFRAANFLRPNNRVVLKLIFLLFDIATMLLIIRLLGHLNLPRSSVIVYAWNPLVVTELASNAHVDVLGILAMTLALTLSIVRGSKCITGPAALAWSATLKPFALPLLPMFLRRHGWKTLIVGAFVIAVITAPYVSQWQSMLATPKFMAKDIRVNTSLFSGFELIGKQFAPDGAPFARVMGALLVAGFSLWPALRGKLDDMRMLRWAVAVIGVTLLISPVLYPWYVTWIVPFLCFSLNPAWLLFTGLVAISYLLPFHDRAPWIFLAEYVPLYGLLLAGAIRGRAGR